MFSFDPYAPTSYATLQRHQSNMLKGSIMTIQSTTDAIRQIIDKHGRLAIGTAASEDDADLYQQGLTSHASVNVMLALENAFDVEFPDRMLKRSVFASISSIRLAIDELTSRA